jgi:hypothetical protein
MTTTWVDAAAPKQLTQEGARKDALVEQFRLLLQKEVLLTPPVLQLSVASATGLAFWIAELPIIICDDTVGQVIPLDVTFAQSTIRYPQST